MNVARFRSLFPWLAEGKFVWLACGISAVALGLALRPGSSEPLIRWTGLVLELLGIATVVWGIAETRAFFGHTPVLTAAIKWIGRFPLRKRNIVLAAAGIASATAFGNARGHVTHVAGSNPTVDARLDALDKNITALHDRITSTQREMDEQFSKTKGDLAVEVSSRNAEDELTRKMLETTATGGVHISAIGAAWLFVGLVLSTAAPELAAWLK